MGLVGDWGPRRAWNFLFGARVGPAWGPRGTRVGGPAWDPRGTRVGPAGFRVPKPTCLLCLCFARRHCRIPFGDHPIKLERYRED